MKIEERELNIIALILFLLFILTKISLFGFFATIIILYTTFYPPFKKGIKHGLIDTLQSLVVAVIFLIVIGLVLGSSAPLDINVSCSMRPVMERGDLIILKSFDNRDIATIKLKNYEDWKKINVSKKPCEVRVADKSIVKLCSYAIQYNNQTIFENYSNPVIIYKPKETDYFAPLESVVHRTFVRLLVDGKEYFLTKGDNNLKLDQEAGNEPVELERIKGQILFQIPYLGYIKLFAFGQINPPPECEITITNKSIATE